jgi:hypothetical protein
MCVLNAELLWVAPELLPLTIVPGTPATQKGDVYSFAIILEEIIVRGGPYEAASQFLGPQGKLDYASLFALKEESSLISVRT